MMQVKWLTPVPIDDSTSSSEDDPDFSLVAKTPACSCPHGKPSIEEPLTLKVNGRHILDLAIVPTRNE
jgi:hypothetical protein